MPATLVKVKHRHHDGRLAISDVLGDAAGPLQALITSVVRVLKEGVKPTNGAILVLLLVTIYENRMVTTKHEYKE